MKKQPIFSTRYSLLVAFTAFFLAACGQPSLEDSETVLKNAKQVLVEVGSGALEITANAKGNNGVDDLVFEGMIGLSFDKRDAENQKLNLDVSVSGDMKAGEESLNGKADFEFITLDKQYYVKLNELNSSDQSLANIKPVLDMYAGKWLRIDENMIPENIRKLQSQDEAMKLKKKQLEDLFVETELFDVVKEYGIEKLNGENVYHYGMSINMEGFKDYMRKAAIIDGSEMTDQEIKDSLKILSYLKEAQIYIDTEDYYVLKADFLFSGEGLNQSTNLEVELSVSGSQFDETIKVEAPADAEDFNPLNLMMGLGGVPTLPVDQTALPEEQEGNATSSDEVTPQVSEEKAPDSPSTEGN